MTQQALDRILTHRRIASEFHCEFRALIECGVQPGKGLRSLLKRQSNYKAALDDALATLSGTIVDEFPPTKEPT